MHFQYLRYTTCSWLLLHGTFTSFFLCMFSIRNDCTVFIRGYLNSTNVNHIIDMQNFIFYNGASAIYSVMYVVLLLQCTVPLPFVGPSCLLPLEPVVPNLHGSFPPGVPLNCFHLFPHLCMLNMYILFIHQCIWYGYFTEEYTNRIVCPQLVQT